MRWNMEARLLRLAALTVVAVALPGGARAQVPESDFQAGDPILLQVEGEQQFTGTFTVVPGPTLVLPVVGEIPLAGVRRADIASYLAQRLGRYFQSTPIHARALVRLSLLGEVEPPGYSTLLAYAVRPDAIMPP